MTWWNSADSVSLAGTVSQIIVALAGIVALVLGIRLSQLQDAHDKETELHIVTAKRDAAKANERAASLENETANARLELERLKSAQHPWELSDAHWSKLQELLKGAPKGKIEVCYLLSDGVRVSGLARRIEAVFREHGFTMAPEIGMISNPANPKGIRITFIKEDDRARAMTYVDIFRALGIPCALSVRDIERIPQDVRFPDPVSITVLSKP
jgi:hypothetical protein